MENEYSVDVVVENDEEIAVDVKTDIIKTKPKLQDKEITITTNGTNTVTYDGSYDGLNNVEITTNVPAPLPALQSKSITITENTTTTITPDSGYDGLDEVEVVTNVISDYNVKLNDSFHYSYSNVNGLISLVEEVDMAGINLTKIRQLFMHCQNLVTVKNLNTDNVTNMYETFYNCNNIVTIPSINTSNVTDFGLCFWNCTNLVNVPVFNFKSIGNMDKLRNFIVSCPNLSNESLNNIMASCLTVMSYVSGTKTLKYIGLSSEQATTCQSLSNWSAFVAAGWSAGY